MKNKLLLSTGAAAFLFLSCKQEKTFGNIEPNTSRVMAEFTDARTGTAAAWDYAPGTAEVDLTELRLEPRTKTNHATTVRIITNSYIVAKHNADNGTAYTTPPGGAFSLAQETYTLSPGQRKMMVRGNIRPTALVDDFYAVGLSIAEMSDGDISATARDVIVFLTIKNPYDGVYRLKAQSAVPGTGFTGLFSVPCSEELALVTSGETSVSLQPAQPLFNSTSGFVYVTNVKPAFRFDKNTQKLSAVNARSGSLDFIFPYDATYDSRYDPATRSIYIKYGIAPAGSGRFVVDTFLFCRPR